MTYKTLTEIKNLVRAFEDCTLPRSCWTHQAHLSVALWYLTHFSEEEAIKCMRDRIRNYNTTIGIKNTNDSGYHETITLFWMQIILSYLFFQGKDCNFLDIVNNLISTYKNERLIFEYYSRNLLFS
jgi:hypothetical protein